MADSRSGTPSGERLLSVIELQNAIAAAGMNADEVMVLVCDRARSLTAAAGGAVAIVEGDDLVYRAVAGSVRTPSGSRVPRATSAAGRCVAERRPLIVDDVGTEGGGGTGSRLCVPLLYGESPVGVLEVAAAKSAAFGDADTETLRLLAQVIAIALHRAYTYPRPRYDADHDALTGLGNRRAFDDRIQAELTRNRRYGHSFSLAVLELEGLESAIDRFGQAAGDEALREVAAILQRHTRAIDACFRITANEVAIVMPGTSLVGAETLVDRCRVRILEAKPCEGTVTASFGVAEASDETADALWTRANTALASYKQTPALTMPAEVLTSGIWQTTSTIVSSGRACAVIDPAYFPRELDAIAARVAELGHAEAVVFTHGHWDHVMGHAALPGAPVWLSRVLDDAIAAGDPRAARYLDDARAFDARWYVPRPAGHRWPERRRGLADGDRVEVGALALRALHLPGHSPEGLGLVIDELGLLLVGDYLSPCEIPFVDDAAAYRATLVRLLEVIAGVAEVIPGHGPRLARDEAAAIARADLAYLDRLLDAAARRDVAGARAIELPRAADVAGMRDHHAENCTQLGLA